MLHRLLCAALLCGPLLGQDNSAPVVIDGQEVVRVYGPLGSFTAKDRAGAIEGRVLALVDKGFTGTIEVRPIPSESATAVVAGPAIIMAVTDIDAQSVGVPRDDLARRYAASLQKAIESYRVRHSWLSFLTSVAKTVGAWILFFVSAWALWKGTRWMGRHLQCWFTRQEEARSVRGLHLLIWERGRLFLMMLVRVAFILFLLSEFSFLLSYTFGLFPQTAGVSTTLMDYL